MPTRHTPRATPPHDLVFIHLWGTLPNGGSVLAHITGAGFRPTLGPHITPPALAAVWAARDAAVELVQTAVREQRDLRGFQVDRACRDVIERAGFGAQFIHRTGHSLGENVHGDGVHMDDYETHDDRRLIPGTGFTIEPGIYTDTYGVRTEINMFVGEREARVTGPRQQELVSLV